MAVGTSKVIQVTNIAPQATKDQMQILFGYLGKIEDIRLYPTIRDVSCPVQSRICYIKFVDSSTVGIAQHMTNTVFIDRALIVIPISSGDIPDEYYALEMTKNATIVPGLTPADPQLPAHVVNSTHKSGDEQVIITVDPNLQAFGLPPYPPLPATYDTVKIEETRRTVLMLNYNSSMSHDDIINFFSRAGEVKYLRLCKSENESDDSTKVLVEFSDQPSVINALKLNGTELKGQVIKVEHATQPIIKPQAKSNEAAQKEIEEAMSRFKEAQNMINASIEPVIGMLTKDKRSSRRSRSRSRSRRKRTRSRSRRSRSRRRRSSSRSKRSRSRDHRKRSRSRRRRTRSRSRRSRSRSVRSKRSRSRSRRRSRHRSKERAKSRDRGRDRSRDRKRSRDRERDKEKDRERDKKSRERESIEKEKTPKELKEKKNDTESSVEDKRKSRSRSRSKRRSRSRDRRTRDRKRSRSRGSRRRSPSPRGSRRRSRTRSRDRERKRDKKTDKRDRERRDRDRRSRSRDKERKSRSRSQSSRSTGSHSKVPRNYDEEEKGFDTDKEKPKDKEIDQSTEKGSPEKSDNMDISNSP
ncbi:probable splicing factor, arginine/serine-rich 7 [Diorhabda sublineata]|uniref:probable splicing factor, arginine/serine-rich 7 n=1 Tax=Diorhabda sublineata TaxID=1163346 RepID=UPI0024E0868B|nr:probable splicing factor, arginine/serine-rich 7 [Diorhabda sublineata]